MPEPSWEYILKSQQEDFLERLESSLEVSSYCDTSVHLARLDHCFPLGASSPCEIINISFEHDEEYEIDKFCGEITCKFSCNPDYFDYDVFISNKLGKIGEEAVKRYLGNWINNVDYELYKGGDGGVDFILRENNKIKIQVKTRAAFRLTCEYLERTENIDITDLCFHFFINAYDYVKDAKWQVDNKAITENNLTIFVLVMNEVIGGELNENLYKCLIAGFLPSRKLSQTRKYSITELLYSGGIRGYLKHLTSTHH